VDYWDEYCRLAQGWAARWIGTADEARRRARRRLLRAMFDYIDGGARAEFTMRANRAVIEAVQFRPQVGVTMGVLAPQRTRT